MSTFTTATTSPRPDLADRLLAAAGGARLETGCLEVLGERAAHLGVVVHDQDRGLVHFSGSPGSPMRIQQGLTRSHRKRCATAKVQECRGLSPIKTGWQGRPLQ